MRGYPGSKYTITLFSRRGRPESLLPEGGGKKIGETMKLKNTLAVAIFVVFIAGAWAYAIDLEMPSSLLKPDLQPELQSLPRPAPRSLEPVPPDTASQGISFKISAVGDCTLGYDYRFQDYFGQTLADQGNDYGYFFRQVLPFLEADDLTIANMEGTLTEAREPAYKGDPAKCFYFKGPPDYVNILSRGSVEAVNLANNHSLDYMEAGNADTRAILAANGIASFGYEEKPIVEVKGVSVGLLGYNMIGPVLGDGETEDYQRAMEEDIGRLRGDCDLVLVSFHWGKEGSYIPQKSQETLGRYAIDLGADLVLGAHPHVIQPIEEYKGKYIVHSLGNFCFGGNRYPGDYDSFIFQQEFVVWKGDDLVQVEAGRPRIIPVSISSVAGVNNFQPSPLEEGQEVYNKLQWQP